MEALPVQCVLLFVIIAHALVVILEVLITLQILGHEEGGGGGGGGGVATAATEPVIGNADSQVTFHAITESIGPLYLAQPIFTNVTLTDKMKRWKDGGGEGAGGVDEFVGDLGASMTSIDVKTTTTNTTQQKGHLTKAETVFQALILTGGQWPLGRIRDRSNVLS